MKKPYHPPRVLAIYHETEQFIATSYVTEQESVTTIGDLGSSTDPEELWGKSSRREGSDIW